MRSLGKTVVLLLSAAMFTAASMGIYAFFFVAMKNKTEATAELLTKVAELSGKETRVTSASAVLKSESVNISKLSSYFIRESEVVVFAKKLEDLGVQSGTSLSIESLDPGLTEKTIPFLSFRIKATGSFSDVMRLIVLLENFPGKLEWKTVRLARDISLDQQTGTATQGATTQTPKWSVEVFLTALNFVKE